MRIWATFLWLVLLSSSAVAAPSRLDRMEQAPAAWTGPAFQPSFRFPSMATSAGRPWLAISFRNEPERYLRTLLDYALEGQDRVDWKLAANRVRGWYHVPWLGPGANGREFIHGLTRARDFAAGELSPAQTSCRQNWAIAFYNDVGGTALARIWRRVAKGQGDPDLRGVPFPVGTVAVKVVYTEATADDDPRLAGAPELLANIPPSCAGGVRTPRTLRLLQFDIAARETRASYKTGWVFGSYIYDGRRPGSDPWAKLVPLGLMWGNDQLLSDADVSKGAKPRQSIVFDAARGFGRGGRMNGLVDERSSACSSCHMAAQWPSVAPMKAPADWARGRCWFRNLDARYPFGFAPGDAGGCGDPSAIEKIWPLDFSLQLAVALRNWSMERANTRIARATKIGKIRRDGDTLYVNDLVSLPLRR
jgi:hypothetical protein